MQEQAQAVFDETEDLRRRPRALDRVLSATSESADLHPDHLADLRRSGLTHETIRMQRIRSVPRGMLGTLLGFNIPGIRSAMLFPFPDPRGGFMDHIRVKVFPHQEGRGGQTIKYLQPRGSGVRLYFPLATMTEAVHGGRPVWLVEGEKKSLAVAQLGLPAVGFCGIEGWHRAGSRALIPDFDHLHLQCRVIELVPDGDWRTNPNVERGVVGLADALEARGARVRLVALPEAAA